jgi:hypothetical protein
MIETPDKGLGYLHRSYEVIEVHTAESVWQRCLCRSCQDIREVKKLPKDTPYRNKDEKY